jgi:hypothetical protein
MKSIHKFLDWQPFPTWVYESWIRLFFEVALLVACAWPAVTTNVSSIAQVFAGLLRLAQVELARKRASILGRATEQGKILPRPELAPEKEHELYVLGWLDDVNTYVLATVAPIAVAFVGGGRVDLVLGLSILATIARTIFDRAAYPAWRKSRLKWRSGRLASVTIGKQSLDLIQKYDSYPKKADHNVPH